MKDWLKTSLLHILLFSALLVGIFYLFNFRVYRTTTDFSFSADIPFSPAEYRPQTESRVYSEKPKNIILFVADGLGFSHMSLALHTQQPEGASSVWQQFDVKGWHDSKSTFGPLTDSGASATAMATGTTTYWEVIGMDEEGEHLTNVFELATEQGYQTGIVTDSYIWDATPAAFVAHTKSRDNSRDILMQIASSELDLLFGELEDVGEDENPDYKTTIEIITQRFHLLDKPLNTPIADVSDRPIAAIYNEDEVQDLNSKPNLTQLTEKALEYLTTTDKPFMLLVECEELDAASHDNNSQRVLRGLRSIQSTLSLLLEFSEDQRETLVVFTSDHETGGLAALGNFDNYPNMQIRWSTKEHTGTVVPLLAKGTGAAHFASVEQTWEIGEILKALIVEAQDSVEHVVDDNSSE